MKVKIINADMANSSDMMLTNPGNTTGDRISALQYPLSIKGSENRHSSYLCFYAVEAVKGGNDLGSGNIDKRAMAAVEGKYNENTLAVIQMYMPNMMENISHNYDKNDTTMIEQMIMNASQAMQQTQGDNVVKKGIAGGKAALHVGVHEAGVVLAKKTKEFNPQMTGQVLGGRGTHMFSSTGLRQQNFIYQFRPRSLAELKEVGRILRAFLVYSSASNTGAADITNTINRISKSVGSDYKVETTLEDTLNPYNTIKVPPLWFIEERVNYGSSAHKIRYTPKFAMGPCAITNIRINKTPEQIYETFYETAGDPIAIDLELTFQELRPVYADYWAALTSNLGDTDDGSFFFGSNKETGK